MCFQINRGAEPWKQRIAYKLLLESAGKLWGPYFKGRTPWTVGEVRVANKGPRRSKSYRAKHGIYVYKTRDDARNAISNTWEHPLRVYRVAVDPEDFLYVCDSNTKATYTKVKLLGKTKV